MNIITVLQPSNFSVFLQCIDYQDILKSFILQNSSKFLLSETRLKIKIFKDENIF